MSEPFTIFVIDDDEPAAASLEALLSSAGFQTDVYSSAEAFLAAHKGRCRGCLLLDVRLNGMSGFELQQVLASRESDLPIILMSGHTNDDMANRTRESRAVTLLEKPFTAEELFRHIDWAMSRDNG